jgi:NCAIR mutase (PurE)-related protein
LIGRLEEILGRVRDGSLQPAEAAGLVSALQDGSMGFAMLDLQRGSRQTLPEVVLAQGKTVDGTVAIVSRLHEKCGFAMATRVPDDAARALASTFPGGRYSALGRCFAVGDRMEPPEGEGPVAVVTAGTSDLPAAEEAAFVLEEMSARVERVFDVGVAGLHRLGGRLDTLRSCGAVVVCAGMDAALPSVVGGLVQCPVIAVPTSTGYGTSFGGVSALLAMLNSCSPGVCVMNIDNGFGAAAAVLRLLRGAPARGRV